MTLYRMEYGATKMRWFGTQEDLRKAVALAKKAGVAVHAEKTEVPTSKPELLAWLNECCNERA